VKSVKSVVKNLRAYGCQVHYLFPMKTQIIHETGKQSITSNLPFPEAVKRFAEAGVESYYADLVQLQKTYYAPDGATCVSLMEMPPVGPVAEQFDAAKVKEAVSAIQQGKISYVEFLRRIVAGGTFAYTVHIRGRRAIYLGRTGDLHVEPFPSAK
jgi:uncharacterized protein YbcV (DUF1398 family)